MRPFGVAACVLIMGLPVRSPGFMALTRRGRGRGRPFAPWRGCFWLLRARSWWSSWSFCHITLTHICSKVLLAFCVLWWAGGGRVTTICAQKPGRRSLHPLICFLAHLSCCWAFVCKASRRLRFVHYRSGGGLAGGWAVDLLITWLTWSLLLIYSIPGHQVFDLAFDLLNNQAIHAFDPACDLSIQNQLSP